MLEKAESVKEGYKCQQQALCFADFGVYSCVRRLCQADLRHVSGGKKRERVGGTWLFKSACKIEIEFVLQEHRPLVVLLRCIARVRKSCTEPLLSQLSAVQIVRPAVISL